MAAEILARLKVWLLGQERILRLSAWKVSSCSRLRSWNYRAVSADAADLFSEQESLHSEHAVNVAKHGAYKSL